MTSGRLELPDLVRHVIRHRVAATTTLAAPVSRIHFQLRLNISRGTDSVAELSPTGLFTERFRDLLRIPALTQRIDCLIRPDTPNRSTANDP